MAGIATFIAYDTGVSKPITIYQDLDRGGVINLIKSQLDTQREPIALHYTNPNTGALSIHSVDAQSLYNNVATIGNPIRVQFEKRHVG